MPITPIRRGAAALFYLTQKSRSTLYNKGLLRTNKIDGLKIISIGNLRAGGSGKTPLAMYLAQRLHDCGEQVALLYRGYRGRLESKGGLVSAGDGPRVTQAQAGDEAYAAALSLKGIHIRVGADRHTQATHALKDGIKVAILDDGFQHQQLYRDLDILLASPSDLASSGPSDSLPHGPMRETAVAANRAHLIGGFDDEWREVPQSPDFTFSYTIAAVLSPDGICSPLETLWNVPVYLVSGIARPERFRTMIEKTGLRVMGAAAFPDHHLFRQGEITRISNEAKTAHAEALLTTTKDLPRLSSTRTTLPIFAAQIAVTVIKGEEMLIRRINAL